MSAQASESPTPPPLQTVGNHDCDFGPDLLANHTLNVNFPILGANINASAHPVLGSTIQPYTIITLSNGIEVGMHRA